MSGPSSCGVWGQMLSLCWNRSKTFYFERFKTATRPPDFQTFLRSCMYIEPNFIARLPTHYILGKLHPAFNFFVVYIHKGQLISKCLFGVFNSSKKTNEKKIRPEIVMVVKSNFFVRFFERIEDSKKSF